MNGERSSQKMNFYLPRTRFHICTTVGTFIQNRIYALRTIRPTNDVHTIFSETKKILLNQFKIAVVLLSIPVHQTMITIQNYDTADVDDR